MKIYRKADIVVVPVIVFCITGAWWMWTRPSIADCPTIGRHDYSPSALLRCANRMIDLGPAKAHRFLRSKSSDGAFSPNDERIALLCRVLYQPRSGERLRRPLFGGPDIPYQSMPEEKWPRRPLAISQDVPFLLVSGYDLAGVAESSRSYLEYSRKNGVFRTEPYKVPSKWQALDALQALFQSERWKAIRWEDSAENWSYRYEEMWLKHRLHLQVSRITGCEE